MASTTSAASMAAFIKSEDLACVISSNMEALTEPCASSMAEQYFKMATTSK